MKTAHEIFHTVKSHLLRQGIRSVSYSDFGVLEGCKYRGSNGTMCAAGCLIAHEHYLLCMEGFSANSPVVEEALRLSGVDMSEENVCALVMQLQSMHDNILPSEWPVALEKIREAFLIAA